ncbi:MAG: alpha/beta hydrolase [Dehalococcoidia bacterium]|nr:alpha/beta hydrolase [Dehalococcoidia bacterium]
MGRSSYITIGNINTHVWETGAGIPLVLVHGFMGTAFDWRSNIRELASHFAVKAFDLPGFGYSDKPSEFKYTSEGYADFLESFLDSLGIKKAVLVGNSMGGEIILQACLKYPDRVSALILIDSGGYPGSVRFLLFRLLKVPLLGPLIMSLVTPIAVKYVLGRILIDKSQITDDLVEYYFDVYKTPDARKIPPGVLRNMMKDEPGIRARLKEINCPACIIWGSRDQVIPPHYARLFNQEIAKSKLVIIDEAGHLPQIDNPDAVNKAIIDFINDCTRSGR